MKDKDTQFLYESYQKSLIEGRKKQFTDRVRKTLVDPDTGEERKESYYEMMMRVKGIRGGGGVRSNPVAGANGGSGIVVLRAPGPVGPTLSVTPEGAKSTLPAPVGGCTLVTFTATGTLTIS